jgi:hypothetical protein
MRRRLRIAQKQSLRRRCQARLTWCITIITMRQRLRHRLTRAHRLTVALALRLRHLQHRNFA